MRFEKFPPEIRAKIIRHLGQLFFKQDVRRLAVSKSWYPQARRVLFGELNLTPSSLVRLATNKFRLERSVEFAKTVRLSLVEDRVGYRKMDCSLEWNYDLVLLMLKQCGVDTRSITNDIEQSLLDLATALQKFSVAKQVVLTARCAPRDFFEDSRLELSKRAVGMFLTASNNLTSLHFDKLDYQPVLEYAGSEWHPCEGINLLFPSLKRLRFRSDQVCDKLLDTSNINFVALQDVVVALMLPSKWKVYKGCCFEENFRKLDTLQSTVRSQAVALARRVKDPIRIGVITCHPHGLTFVFDAVTGARKRFKRLCSAKVLQDWDSWEGNGELLGEDDIRDQVDFQKYLTCPSTDEDEDDQSDEGDEEW